MENDPQVVVRFHRRRNKLKEKVMGLDQSGDSGKTPTIDPEILAKAQKIFEDMSEDYPDWVNGLITELAELRRRCVDEPEARRGIFERIAAIAHDMKGQGGTFGYPLITEFADSLYKVANIRKGFADHQVEIIKAHIDSMRAVIRDRVSGDGGEIGVALTTGLKSTIEKLKR